MNEYMLIAIEESKKCLKTNDVPVGCVIVDGLGNILARAHNTREKEKIITKHAEINALEQSCKVRKNWHLNDCVLFSTVEPCEMCMAAIYQARIKKVVFSVYNKKFGASNRYKTKMVFLTGDYEDEVKKIMCSFFENKR